MRGLRLASTAAAWALVGLALWLVGREIVAEVITELADDRSGPRLTYLPDHAQRALRGARHSGAWG